MDLLASSSNLKECLSFAGMNIVQLFFPLHERIFVNHLKVVQVHEQPQQQTYTQTHHVWWKPAAERSINPLTPAVDIRVRVYKASCARPG